MIAFNIDFFVDFVYNLIRYLGPYAGIAQLVEQRFCKPWVGGSIPLPGSILRSSGATDGVAT